jgi:hypothetical protein
MQPTTLHATRWVGLMHSVNHYVFNSILRNLDARKHPFSL